MVNSIMLTFFIIVAAVAIVVQALVMVGLYHKVQDLEREVEGIRGDFKLRFDPVLGSISQILADAREPMGTIMANLAEISRILRERASQVDGVVADLLDKSRVQIIRVDQMLVEIVRKVEATADIIQRSVLAPIQEITAVIKGFKSAVEFLRGRRRPSNVREAIQDEQLFI